MLRSKRRIFTNRHFGTNNFQVTISNWKSRWLRTAWYGWVRTRIDARKWPWRSRINFKSNHLRRCTKTRKMSLWASTASTVWWRCNYKNISGSKCWRVKSSDWWWWNTIVGIWNRSKLFSHPIRIGGILNSIFYLSYMSSGHSLMPSLNCTPLGMCIGISNLTTYLLTSNVTIVVF